MKKRWDMLVVVFAILILFVGANGIVSGAVVSESMCVSAEVTSINPSSVDADEDFTVGIQIENCGEEIPENVFFEITRLSSEISVKESLLMEVGKINYADSKRFITYHMHSAPGASPGIHNFETKLTYVKDGFSVEKKGEFAITVISYEADLSISRVATTPEMVEEGQRMTLTIDVENAGKGEARDVRVEVMNLEFSGVKQKYLGKIDYGENIPARFVFDSTEPGIYGADVKITYKEGGEDKELTFPIEIQVFDKHDSYYWVIAIVLILVLFIYYLVRKHSRSKK